MPSIQSISADIVSFINIRSTNITFRTVQCPTLGMENKQKPYIGSQTLLTVQPTVQQTYPHSVCFVRCDIHRHTNRTDIQIRPDSNKLK